MDDRAAVLPPEGRRTALVAAVRSAGFLRVADAALELGVSEVTVRADLAALDAAGLVRRVHGGATATGSLGGETSLEQTGERDAAIKRAIGVAAAARIRPGESVLLDVGSTALAVARALVARTDLVGVTVITNGLSIALELEAAIPRFTVVVTGGTLRPLQHSLVNPLGTTLLAGLNADVAILGCNGVDGDGLVTNLNLPEAEVKRAMLGAAVRRILVVDGSKAGIRRLGTIGALAEFDAVVTDGRALPLLAEPAAAGGVELVVVDAGPASPGAAAIGAGVTER
ncbi:DeoR family transcriptional regulator [Agromyces seonyuensis]|uniref:DeoR family transcriptional regulator n=1 Tax=Agromyces seonyuensis TaxID=2662446 RepID=A0A6I4P6T9_9MICO|nr:DeoR family transcriptional regulator [Agromyces seonyuensis]